MLGKAKPIIKIGGSKATEQFLFIFIYLY